MLFVLLYVFLLVLGLYTYLTWNFNHWRRIGVKGPPPRAYIGTFPKTALFDRTSNYIYETSEIFRFVNITYRTFPQLNQIETCFMCLLSENTIVNIVSSEFLNIVRQSY